MQTRPDGTDGFWLSRAPAWVGRAPVEAAPRLARLVRVAERLPGGLAYARRITFVPDPPPFLSPLSPGSPWHALGDGLVVAVGGDPARMDAVLQDLVAYQELAWTLRGLPPGPSAQATLALAERLEASLAQLEALGLQSPGLAADLQVLAAGAFDPEIRIHPQLLPERQAEAGARIAQGLLDRIPAGRFYLLVSEGRAPLDLLSPYAADLGHSLYQWGLEHPDALEVRGLVDALAATQGAPDRDLAALVAQRLARWPAEGLLEERRDNEAGQGLWLEDGFGATWGVADLVRLAAPDPGAIRGEPFGVLAVVAGGGPALREAATGHLAASGRLEAVALVGHAPLDGVEPVVPDALTWDQDGVRLELAPALVRFAARHQLAARRVGTLTRAGGPTPVARLLGQLRRARVAGLLDPTVKEVVVLAPQASQGGRRDVPKARVELAAGRLALAALLDPDLAPAQVGPKPLTSSGDSRVSRRFRA
ncbi:MAG: hypothetical protein H6730_12075 [Deltaproteobacteria bacterium]|nr:hypothetical protein [Deltaproteobacteria bacterium]